MQAVLSVLALAACAVHAAGPSNLSAAVTPGQFFFLRLGTETFPQLAFPGVIDAVVALTAYPDGPAWLGVLPGDNRSLVISGTVPDTFVGTTVQVALVNPAYVTVPLVLTVAARPSTCGC